MFEGHIVTLLWTGLAFLIHLAFVVRAILRPHRQPASRVAWVAVILLVPLVGIVAYIFLGETNIGRKRSEKAKAAFSKVRDLAGPTGDEAKEMEPEIPEKYDHLFRVGYSVSGFDPVGGNRACLMKDSVAGIDSIVADIDAAKGTVHIVFYIWLCDNSGLKIADALKRAAARGVTCRVMADGVGSRVMIRSPHWKMMKDAGVNAAVTLPIGNLLARAVTGRIDLRNHRKIVVIDNWITYCGSQNCADPEFRIKAKYAPWVDVLFRFAGPVARQNQRLFVVNWMAEVGEDLVGVLEESFPPLEPGFPAQVIGTGPMNRPSAMPEVFENLIYAARESLIITTPYYVPNESMQEALCACARRGVETTIIFPAKNDSFEVGAASRSYYAELIDAGVRIFEYEGGLLHAKTLTLDGGMSLIGSANMDRRSFELNFENNILFYDVQLTAELRLRQKKFLAQSNPVTQEMVDAWPIYRRFLNNVMGMPGPVL